MKLLGASLWQRRWCRFVGVGVILCAMSLLHPFVRQSIFGPTIEGIPWCVWEDQFRRQAHGNPKKAWIYQMLEKVGISTGDGVALNPHGQTATALHMHLADDSDVKVRRAALGALVFRGERLQAEIAPILREHLKDNDPECRLLAAHGIWLMHNDLEIKAIVLPLIAHRDHRVRQSAAQVMWMMAPKVPELFEPLSQLAEDSDPGVRCAALGAMAFFGKRGVPILRAGLKDGNRHVRTNAVMAASRMGKDAEDLFVDLRAMQSDSDANNRHLAAHALHRLDPKQFPKPADWVD